MTLEEKEHFWFSSDIYFGSDLTFLFNNILPLVVSMCSGFSFRCKKVANFAMKKIHPYENRLQFNNS